MVRPASLYAVGAVIGEAGLWRGLAAKQRSAEMHALWGADFVHNAPEDHQQRSREHRDCYAGVRKGWGPVAATALWSVVDGLVKGKADIVREVLGWAPALAGTRRGRPARAERWLGTVLTEWALQPTRGMELTGRTAVWHVPRELWASRCTKAHWQKHVAIVIS